MISVAGAPVMSAPAAPPSAATPLRAAGYAPTVPSPATNNVAKSRCSGRPKPCCGRFVVAFLREAHVTVGVDGGLAGERPEHGATNHHAVLQRPERARLAQERERGRAAENGAQNQSIRTYR